MLKTISVHGLFLALMIELTVILDLDMSFTINGGLLEGSLDIYYTLLGILGAEPLSLFLVFCCLLFECLESPCLCLGLI